MLCVCEKPENLCKKDHSNVLCKGTRCYHTANETQVTDRILKLIPVHASVIFRFSEFVGLTELNESSASFRNNRKYQLRLIFWKNISYLRRALNHFCSPWYHCFGRWMMLPLAFKARVNWLVSKISYLVSLVTYLLIDYCCSLAPWGQRHWRLHGFCPFWIHNNYWKYSVNKILGKKSTSSYLKMI